MGYLAHSYKSAPAICRGSGEWIKHSTTDTFRQKEFTGDKKSDTTVFHLVNYSLSLQKKVYSQGHCIQANIPIPRELKTLTQRTTVTAMPSCALKQESEFRDAESVWSNLQNHVKELGSRTLPTTAEQVVISTSALITTNFAQQKMAETSPHLHWDTKVRHFT